MNRRDVLATTAILVSQGSSLGAAEPRMLRSGVLAFSESATGPPKSDVFFAELAKHGYVVGRNLAIERRFSRDGGLEAAASALVALKVDLIYAVEGTPAALAAKRATSSIPSYSRARIRSALA